MSFVSVVNVTNETSKNNSYRNFFQAVAQYGWMDQGSPRLATFVDRVNDVPATPQTTKALRRGLAREMQRLTDSGGTPDSAELDYRDVPPLKSAQAPQAIPGSATCAEGGAYPKREWPYRSAALRTKHAKEGRRSNPAAQCRGDDTTDNSSEDTGNEEEEDDDEDGDDDGQEEDDPSIIGEPIKIECGSSS